VVKPGCNGVRSAAVITLASGLGRRVRHHGGVAAVL
jgi:hypothetical protein